MRSSLIPNDVRADARQHNAVAAAFLCQRICSADRGQRLLSVNARLASLSRACHVTHVRDGHKMCGNSASR